MQDNANAPAVPGNGERTDVGPIDQHGALAHVVETADQIDQSALACAGGAHQADHLARLHLQADGVDDLPAAEAEAGIVYLDGAADLARMHGMRRSGTPGGRSRISNRRWLLAAAFCVLVAMRLMDSSRA